MPSPGATILIVEDEGTLLQALELIMKGEGYAVLTAQDGEVGLETALDQHPDMILLDLLMPGMDGIEMLSRLREDDWGKDAKVIVLTNLSDQKNAESVKSANVLEYIVKSDIEIKEVVEKIKGHLRK